MPFTVAENQIGQLWTFAELSRLNTSGGEGVTILHSEEFEVPFDPHTGDVLFAELPGYESADSDKKPPTKKAKKPKRRAKRKTAQEAVIESGSGSDADEPPNETQQQAEKTMLKASQRGIFTKKNYHMASKFPWYIRKVLPAELATLHESSWNMYPTVRTLLTNDYFKGNFRISIDTVTRTVRSGQCESNVHGLSGGELEAREVIDVDIAGQVDPSEYRAEEDPSRFESVKSGRGPLVAGEWFRGQQPLICVYKLVKVEFRVFGLQTRVEGYMRSMYGKLFRDMHRQIFCWSDRWWEVTLEEVRQIERELQRRLEIQIRQGEVSAATLAAGDS